jgi:two-component system, OmpR family, aerobic respiration control sensor histidine kinase ArcB
MLNVLLVEDTPVIQIMVKMVLTKNFVCKIAIASNKEGALGEVAKKKFDIIFMDLGLPNGVNGWDVAREIRLGETKNTKVPIIALTAFDNDEAREACKAAGMNDFIIKPLSFEVAKKVFNKFI